MSRHSITVALLFVLFGTRGAFAQFPVDESGKPTFAPILREVLPAVVNISVVSTARATPNPFFNDPFFERFFDLPEQPEVIPQQSAGSGVIVDASEGYVLTNHHVIENADEIVVTLADRRRFNAELIGSDAGTDIALL
jgi:S1-C subfamily serine protease